MSESEHIQAIMLPITEYGKLSEAMWSTAARRFTFDENQSKSEYYNGRYGFDIIAMQDNDSSINYYLAYVLTKKNENIGDFGYSRRLGTVEKKYWKRKFFTLISTIEMVDIIDINPEAFRYVEYCCYSNTEPFDYYKRKFCNQNTIIIDMQNIGIEELY